MMRPLEVLVLLGGNEGDLQEIFRSAENELSGSGRILARSRDHWTEPWGFKDPRLFLNRALLISTDLPPDALMAECLEIERRHGRVRKIGQPAPRPLDIDILLIEDLAHRSEILQVPHPRMHLRTFALQPAADIVPLWVHPHEGATVIDLLQRNLPTFLPGRQADV